MNRKSHRKAIFMLENIVPNHTKSTPHLCDHRYEIRSCEAAMLRNDDICVQVPPVIIGCKGLGQAC